MYVIIQGSITIEKNSSDFGGLTAVVGSLYDGDQFGEVALLSSANEIRTASCLAAEDCTLLGITRDNYLSIVYNNIDNSISEKVEFLSKIPLFACEATHMLVPLASNLTPITYGINETILAQGARPEGLYIILKGQCVLYKEGYSLREKFRSPNANPKIR